MSVAAVEFILYACPQGPLAAQLKTYFQKSWLLCGANTAHRYMPHCTLTGFFKDEVAAVEHYLQGVEQTLCDRPLNQPVATITQMSFQADWHGLVVQSSWLIDFTADFAQRANSPTRLEPLRLKDWLHVSLAYGFQPQQAGCLQQLAEALIDPRSPVDWELRFYQRFTDNTWICHQSWALPG